MSPLGGPVNDFRKEILENLEESANRLSIPGFGVSDGLDGAFVERLEAEGQIVRVVRLGAHIGFAGAVCRQRSQSMHCEST